MKKPVSVIIGDFLFKNIFPVYNFIYPIFKRRQDAEEISLIRKIVKKDDIIMDIGANIGFYSKILADLTGPTGKVYAFEPDQQNLKYLNSNVKAYQNITVVPKAVSQETGKIKIYTSKFLNVDHRTYPVDSYDSIHEIDAITLDEFVGEKFKVDFIKMDIQGAEVFALRGMSKTLAANPDLKIISEFWPHGLEKAGMDVLIFFDEIQKNNFNVYLIENDKFIPINREEIGKFINDPPEKYMNVLISKKPL